MISSLTGAWSWFRGSFAAPRPRKPAALRQARLRLEPLEARIVPAFTDIWTGGGGDSDWFNAKNWSAAQVPTYTDDVEIPFGTVVINGGGSQFATANTVTVDGGSLDIQDYLDTSGFTQAAGSTVLESGARLFAFEGFMQTGGSFVLAGGTIRGYNVELAGGTMSGFGSIQGPELGTSVLNDGGVLSTSGPFLIVGDYTQTAAGSLVLSSISSTSPGSAPLVITGNAIFDGALTINFSTGATGSYPLIDYATVSGTFASVTASLPSGYALGGLDYTVNGSTELVALVVLAPIPPTPTPTPVTPTTPTLPDPLVITILINDSNSATPPITGTTTVSSTTRTNELPTTTVSVIASSHNDALGVAPNSDINSGSTEPADAVDTKRPPATVAKHGLEVFEVDDVLAQDLDQILRVQMKPYAVSFERDVLTGASIVRSLLTGTTPRTDLLAQDSQVAAVATLVVNTDVLPPGMPTTPGEKPLDLLGYLIDPLRSYSAPLPSASPLMLGPVKPPPPPPPLETRKLTPSWWQTIALLGAAAGALHFANFGDATSEPKRQPDRE